MDTQAMNRSKTLLVTGHKGLIGRALCPVLRAEGFTVRGYDMQDGSGDILDVGRLAQAMVGVEGVIHLAAVSRVIWGEKNPQLCWETNAVASENLLQLASRQSHKPWIVVASSREVYGEPTQLPVQESAPLLPVNIYGRAKLAMEQHALNARGAGLNTAIVRFANVYGCTRDHPDRVLPAFCRNAAEGQPLRVDGLAHLFDFTHVSDTVVGLMRIIALLDAGEEGLPPIHLLPGIGTTLLEAAQMAVAASERQASIVESPSRNFDVSRFVGDPGRAQSLLGWRARIEPQQGIAALVRQFMSQPFGLMTGD